MIRNTGIVLVMVITLSLQNCRGQKEAVTDSQPVVEEVIVDRSFSVKEHNTAVNIHDAAMLSEHIVRVVFSYSGGCKEHRFSLYSSGPMIKTLPPKYNFFLVDHQKEDSCRELITDTLLFNLSPALQNTDKAVGILNYKYEFQIKN